MGNTTAKSHYPKNLTIGGNSRRTRWEGPGIPAPPGKPLLIPGADESEPEVVAIRWERSPSNSGSAIVGYLVEHRRLGSQHWVRSTAELCTFPELTLSGLEPGWRYQFRVRAQNAVGLSRPSEISDPLTVTLQRAVASAPQFDLELKDTLVLENEQAEFVVRFTGTPLPKISWFKDGFEIFSSRRTKIMTDNGKSVLLIHQTALNDEGEIKCTATNRAGHVSTKGRLILEAPPKIRLPRQYEDGLLFEQDETIRLKVSLVGRPAPSVTWFHDGEVIPNDERHIFELMDGESVLKIPDAKRKDRGEYTVKATNKLGDDISSFLVTVTDRPAAPGKATVTMTLGRSVTLSWKEPEDDGGCKIGTYIVEYYRIGWDVWLKATTSRQTTATLSELIEGSEYKFRVKAENPYGVSDPSEETDVVFIPDLKRGITTPTLSGKSQSHREISRSRGEKREVSFVVPSQRTRSLTREEARPRYDESDGRFGPGDRSASAQKLYGSGRPSRTDSRVTFALDTFVHDDNSEAPVPPARTRDHSGTKLPSRIGNYTDQSSFKTEAANHEELVLQRRERAMSPKTVTTVTISPPPSEEISKRTAFRESRSRSVSVTRERSMSPLATIKIQESWEEETPADRLHLLSPNLNLKLNKQQAIVEELDVSSRIKPEDKPGSPTTPREGDERALHGSSEFMLVLYPDDQNQGPKFTGDIDERRILETKGASTEGTEEEEEDLIPPPMSLSLPELFSAEHQVVETLREAVSSTELLHERAMERFYKAVAAEEASEVAKRKSQIERLTGELASSKVEAVKYQLSVDSDTSDLQDARRSSLRRRLSNSGVTTQNLITSWQTKKSRRRSSEGHAEVGYTSPTKLLLPNLLIDVEARSDPNLPRDLEPATGNWGRTNEGEVSEPLRRWHDSNVRLVEKSEEEKSMPWADSTNETAKRGEEMAFDAKLSQKELKEEKMAKEEELEEEFEESIETSEESSEEASSADSEDLRMLKTRILARQVLEEEDTYHPRGTPIPHVDPESPEIPSETVPILDVSPPTPVRSVTPISPSPIVPKSILKKPKEEPIPLNSFGRPIPPEKPIRKSPPQPVQQQEEEKVEEVAQAQNTNILEIPRTPVLSESDTDSVLSAGEAAKNRRLQAKARPITPEEEEADMEARMAVVSHYTEIVREHSSRYNYRSSEERRFGDSRSGSRRSSFSEDYDQLNHVSKPRDEPPPSAPIIIKQEPQVIEHIQVKEKVKPEVNKIQRQDSQQPSSRRSSVSRGTTPAPETKQLKEKRTSRAPSRNESPAPRSRNVSSERGGASSRSSSKTRVRAPSQDRTHRPPSRTGSEEKRFSREKSTEPSTRRSKVPSRSSSRTPSRSSSKDRQRPTTPVQLKMERLQKALESKTYRSLRRGSGAEREYLEPVNAAQVPDERLAIEAQRNVRSTVDYVTDLTLLLAAVYVYFFKKEILAIPFIGLLLYRRIQQEIHGRVSHSWWWSKRKQ